MRCLVTGASGHLGSFLTRLLVARGEDVTVLVRPSGDLWRLDGVLDKSGSYAAASTIPTRLRTICAVLRPKPLSISRGRASQPIPGIRLRT